MSGHVKVTAEQLNELHKATSSGDMLEDWNPIENGNDILRLIRSMKDDGYVGLFKVDGLRPDSENRSYNAIPPHGEYVSFGDLVVAEALMFYGIKEKPWE